MSTKTEAETQTLELIGQQKLVLERNPANNTLKLIGSDGQIRFSICVTPNGPVFRFEGSCLAIESAGDLSVDARRVIIHGQEGVAITSGGDASICVAGELNSEANSHKIIAQLGSVKVKANDEVQLLGEEVLLNCERESPLPSWLPREPEAEVTLPRKDTDGDQALIAAIPPL